MNCQGNCHCGGVKFDADGELTGVMARNRSICSRKGALMWLVPRDKLPVTHVDGRSR